MRRCARLARLPAHKLPGVSSLLPRPPNRRCRLTAHSTTGTARPRPNRPTCSSASLPPRGPMDNGPHPRWQRSRRHHRAARHDDASFGALPAETAFIVLSFLDAKGWGCAALASRHMYGHVRQLLDTPEQAVSCHHQQATLCSTVTQLDGARILHIACTLTDTPFSDCVRLLAETAVVERDILATHLDGTTVFDRLAASASSPPDQGRLQLANAAASASSAQTMRVQAALWALRGHHLAELEDLTVFTHGKAAAAQTVVKLLLLLSFETWSHSPRRFERLLRHCRQTTRAILLDIDTKLGLAADARFPLLAQLRRLPLQLKPMAYPAKLFLPPSARSLAAMADYIVSRIRRRLRAYRAPKAATSTGHAASCAGPRKRWSSFYLGSPLGGRRLVLAAAPNRSRATASTRWRRPRLSRARLVAQKTPWSR
jgi:hypothetical protein